MSMDNAGNKGQVPPVFKELASGFPGQVVLA
jgi:hypothetical protein